MHKRIGPLLLWLFVINLGIAFGAGVYEARVVLPQWAHLLPQTWPNTGLLFWAYVTTIPLTLLTLANLITACLERGPRRAWWLGAVALTEMLLRLHESVRASYYARSLVGPTANLIDIWWRSRLSATASAPKLA
jgi:hypothetical protein